MINLNFIKSTLDKIKSRNERKIKTILIETDYKFNSDNTVVIEKSTIPVHMTILNGINVKEYGFNSLDETLILRVSDGYYKYSITKDLYYNIHKSLNTEKVIIETILYKTATRIFLKIEESD